MKFIVLLVHQNGSAIPMMRDDGYTMHEFATAAEASAAGANTMMGSHFGFEVLRWSAGVMEVI